MFAFTGYMHATAGEAFEFGSLDDAGLAEALTAAENDRRRTEARMAGLVAEARARGSWAVDGHRTVRAWAEVTAGVSRVEAARLERAGRACRELGEVGAAWAGGEVGRDVVAAMAGAWSNPRVRQQVRDTEADLLAQARAVAPDDAATVLAHWVRLADVDGARRNAVSPSLTR